MKVRAQEAGNTAQVCTLKESAVSGVRYQLSKELEQSSRDRALTKAVKLAKEKAVLLAKSAGVELGTLQSLVDRTHSMTINADVDEKVEYMRLPALSEPSRESNYELNFAAQKISVYESVLLAYATI